MLRKINVSHTRLVLRRPGSTRT